MTVQQLIDQLTLIENKNLKVMREDYFFDSFEIGEVVEVISADLENNAVHIFLRDKKANA